MAEWVEISARRVLVVTSEEYQKDFRGFTEDGSPLIQTGQLYRVVREKDGRVFKPATYQPYRYVEREIIALEEI